MAERTVQCHDDLNEEGKPSIWRFCCPIFITNQFGTAIAPTDDLVSGSDQLPKIRSGTLTFVKHGGHVYGITCAHVVKALQKENDRLKLELFELCKAEVPFPPQAQAHFFFQSGNYQIHINAHFHLAPNDEFTGTGPDLAFARIPAATFTRIGRQAIMLNPDDAFAKEWAIDTVAIAAGFPETSRRSRQRAGPLQTLSVPCVTIWCVIDKPTGSTILMHDDLGELDSSANVLSGMSGGPIIASNAAAWSLLGIIKEGRDLRIDGDHAANSFAGENSIWIEGEPISHPWLISLLEAIPEEEPPPDLSKELYVPSGFAQIQGT